MQKAFRRLSALQRLPFSTVSSTFSNGCNNYIKLSNGVRVVSDPVQGPFCAGGLYIPYGSRHEHPERELGACYLYEKLGLKQTMKSSPQQIHQKLEKLGYSVQVSLLRDGLLVSGAVLPYQFEELLSFLSEVILWPKFDKEDGEKCREIMDFDLLTLKEKPETLLTELTHYFMYPPSSTSLNSGLRNGLLKWEIENLKDTIQVPNLETFLKRIVQPQNMIVGVAGLSAEQIAPLVEKYFGHLSASLCTSNSILEEKAKSQSGLFRYESKDLLYSYALSEANMYTHYNHFQVSFPSFNHHEREIFPQAVLTSLLGGGSSFSAGGPGKGLFSRLYRNLLNRYGFIEAAYATEMSYSDVGYFATQGSCEIGQEENTFRYLVREVCRMMPSRTRFSTATKT